MNKVDRFECPGCGNNNVQFDMEKQKLVCQYCKNVFDAPQTELVNNEQNILDLQGNISYEGTKNINKESENVFTIICDGCGAQVIIDTSEAAYARCHWCRSVLSLNSLVENGSMPDVVLPFGITKEQAQYAMNQFASKRRFYANEKFKKEFTTDNIMGVYFPYMIVDANVSARLVGVGEIETRKYTIDKKTYYDADQYSVMREFDVAIDDLTLESSSDRIDKVRTDKTNNIINSIMPFDTNNCVPYKGNYLVGYTSEKRDMDIDDLENKVNKQIRTVTRHSIFNTIDKYNRGVRWDNENINIKGKRWISAYLPVWLYSYQEVRGNKKTLHYIAVNGRTNETMGSIPINYKKLMLITLIIELILFIISTFLCINDDGELNYYLLCAGGLIYYGVEYSKYRNDKARHTFEKETKTIVSNYRENDQFIQKNDRQRSSSIDGRNDNKIEE